MRTGERISRACLAELCCGLDGKEGSAACSRREHAAAFVWSLQLRTSPHSCTVFVAARLTNQVPGLLVHASSQPQF
jgi:hypothetical protein